jgi:hypothetical protein
VEALSDHRVDRFHVGGNGAGDGVLGVVGQGEPVGNVGKNAAIIRYSLPTYHDRRPATIPFDPIPETMYNRRFPGFPLVVFGRRARETY